MIFFSIHNYNNLIQNLQSSLDCKFENIFEFFQQEKYK